MTHLDFSMFSIVCVVEYVLSTLLTVKAMDDEVILNIDLVVPAPRFVGMRIQIHTITHSSSISRTSFSMEYLK